MTSQTARATRSRSHAAPAELARLEFYGFLHFTVNTFTDKEWGYGDEIAGDLQPHRFRRRPDRARGRAGGHDAA